MISSEEEQLGDVVDAITRTIGAGVIGIYQYGSAVRSGLKPRSDLDVLTVVSRPTTWGQRLDLTRGLLAVSGNGRPQQPGRPVEVTIVSQDRVRPWQAPGRREYQYGEWLRAEYETGLVPAPEVDHDLALLLLTARDASKALTGPPLRWLIDPIPANDVMVAMCRSVPGLLQELDNDTRNVLLTLARMWYTTYTMDIVAKDIAAAWALARLPADLRAPVAHARAVYLDTESETFGSLDCEPMATADFISAAILANCAGSTRWHLPNHAK